MLGLLLWCLRTTWGPMRRLVALVEERLGPHLTDASIGGIVLLAVLAGIGEELLFRGVVQVWLAERAPLWLALAAASVLFGVGHWLSASYAILASLIGAYLASWIDWRAAFIVMGIAGIALAPVMLLVVRDKPRPGGPAEPAPRLLSTFPMVARKPSFWLMATAASCSSLAGYGLALWTPTVLERSFHLDIVDRGQFLAAIFLIGGTAGVFAGGWLADRLGQADRSWYAKLPAIAWLITAPTFAIGLLAPTAWIAWPLLLIPNALNILWLGPVTAAVQHLVAQPMRSTASASFLLINNLVGLGVGPTLIGALSEAFKARLGDEALRYAAVSVVGFYLLAALLMYFAIGRLRRDWVEEPATA